MGLVFTDNKAMEQINYSHAMTWGVLLFRQIEDRLVDDSSKFMNVAAKSLLMASKSISLRQKLIYPQYLPPYFRIQAEVAWTKGVDRVKGAKD